MPKTIIAKIDMIEELRERRWARENYLPEGNRTGSLHPAALDEMRRKDAELRKKPRRRSAVCCSN